MTAVWNNPEFIRNVRAQLRPGKVLATACIAAAISIAVGFALSHEEGDPAGARHLRLWTLPGRRRC